MSEINNIHSFIRSVTGKTSTGVRGRDIEEGTGKYIGGRRNMNATICGDSKLDRTRNERIREAPKVGEIAKKL